MRPNGDDICRRRTRPLTANLVGRTPPGSGGRQKATTVQAQNVRCRPTTPVGCYVATRVGPHHSSSVSPQPPVRYRGRVLVQMQVKEARDLVMIFPGCRATKRPRRAGLPAAQKSDRYQYPGGKKVEVHLSL